MKKFLSITIASLAMAVILPSSALAGRSVTDVSGKITNNGNPVKGAKVTVDCNGKMKTDKKTNASGDYFVQFSAVKCPDGSTVNITASKDGNSGSGSGTVNSETTRLNVAIVNVSVPEFGVITGLGAGLLGGGALLVIRRRKLGKQAV